MSFHLVMAPLTVLAQDRLRYRLKTVFLLFSFTTFADRDGAPFNADLLSALFILAFFTSSICSKRLIDRAPIIIISRRIMRILREIVSAR